MAVRAPFSSDQGTPRPMPLENLSRAKSLFYAARERPPSGRAAFLEAATDGDLVLRTEVERLLSLDSAAEGFFDALGAPFQRPPAAIELPVPERIGPWRIVREVGRGGMGRVLLAERADGAFEHRVAVKVVESAVPGVVERFRRERRILGSLDHPNVARLLDGGALPDGRPYLIMEYVDGVPITRFAEDNTLAIGDRLQLFVQVCRVVAYAHRSLVVHRDLKPSNILVTTSAPGRADVKLLDFGIARLLDPDRDDALTSTGQRLHTPAYAAPEQILGKPVTTAADVYALGAILYELLTGRRPFDAEGRTWREQEAAILEDPPPMPSAVVGRAGDRSRQRRHLRGDLDRIALVALRKEPERRYRSVESLTRDVERHLAGLPIEARSATLGYRWRSFTRRHPVGVALGAVLSAILVSAALWTGALHAYEVHQRIPFADRVEAYDHRGTVTNRWETDPNAALHMPGHRSLYGSSTVSLGNGGSLTLAFTDNVLRDGPGPDLVVWEMGVAEETVEVSVSESGERFVSLGVTASQHHAFDLAGLGQPDAAYRYVQLRDVIEPGDPTHPRGSAGADIDAVLAINGAPAPPRPLLVATAALGRVLRTAFTSDVDEQVNLVGGDYSWFFVESGGGEACLDRCQSETACRAWTFLAPVGTEAGRCQLKAVVASPEFCAHCVSGIVRP